MVADGLLVVQGEEPERTIVSLNQAFQDIESSCKEQVTLFLKPNYLGCVMMGERCSTAKFYILHGESQQRMQKDNLEKIITELPKSYFKKSHQEFGLFFP